MTIETFLGIFVVLCVAAFFVDRLSKRAAAKGKPGFKGVLAELKTIARRIVER